MFGFSGGEAPDVVARKKGYMRDAQAKWPFLTNFDLSTLKTEAQLASMVKDRSSVPKEQAASDVKAWAADKQF